VISRQKLVGWILIVFGGAMLVYFLRVRLFAFGPPLERKEWFYFIAYIALIMIGTMNVRLAAMRERQRNSQSQ
jgi:Na+/melibiose symporter-like transporter